MIKKIFFSNFVKQAFWVLIILCIAAAFRFYNMNWDQNQHLHPDERFLTMVVSAMKLPSTFADYIDPTVSTLNPANLNFSFFVYGLFPLTLTKLLVLYLHKDTYDLITIVGRYLSAGADLLVVLVIYKLVLLLQKPLKLSPSIKLYASFFYAIAVLPIQLSHFFAVDTFLSLFMLTSFYCIVHFYYKRKSIFVFFSALLLGLAVASKISAIYILPLNLFFLFIPLTKIFFHLKQKLSFSPYNLLVGLKGFSVVILYGIILYSTVRLADPYLFEHQSIFAPEPSHLFVQNIKALQAMATRDIGFPPSVQWISKVPIIFSLTNLIFFGLGLPFALIVAVGFYYFFRYHRTSTSYILFLWILLFFLYQGYQVTQSMRYFLILYPFFSIIGAIGFYHLTQKRNLLVKAGIILLLLIWPLSFLSIYTKPHTRITASEWIYQHIPSGTPLLAEHWDDALPLPLAKYADKSYSIQQLPVFDPDTDAKWATMNKLLSQGEYLILSSNRGWGSITTVPDKYPQMSKFYNDLFANRLQYKKVKEFTSYPSLQYLGIPVSFPDDWAEEAFTVYDHPKVLIFKKEN